MREKWYTDLEANLDAYDQIFLVIEHRFLELFEEAEPTVQKLLILFPEGMRNRVDRTCGGISFRRICTAEATQLQKFYLTYEFSNRFHLLSNSGYGNLLNYIDTGLLSRREALVALLHGGTGRYG